jgi:hypothetical protein
MRILRKHRHYKREMLSKYMDDDLPATTRDRITSQLQSCSVCSIVLERLRFVDSLLGELPKIPLPHSFTLTPASLEALRVDEASSKERRGLADILIAAGISVTYTLMEKAHMILLRRLRQEEDDRFEPITPGSDGTSEQ